MRIGVARSSESAAQPGASGGSAERARSSTLSHGVASAGQRASWMVCSWLA